MEGDVSLVLARSKPADIPDPGAATRDLYNQFVKTFGEKEVIAAASAVLHTPKNSMGGLAKRADIVVGTYLSMPSPDPYMLFLTELTNRSSRTYAVTLCMDRNNLLGGEATATFNKKEHWADALSMYEKIVAKYGEANVLAAAARIKDAPKDSNGIRGDTQAKGTIIWFQALLKDPKTELPEAGLFRASSTILIGLAKKSKSAAQSPKSISIKENFLPTQPFTSRKPALTISPSTRPTLTCGRATGAIPSQVSSENPLMYLAPLGNGEKVQE